MKKITLIMFMASLVGLSGCRASEPAVHPPLTGAMPKAVVYKVSGDYADHVFVNVSADGSKLLYFPAPSDIDPQMSAPVKLDYGYYLCRQGGIGENSRFLTWTYQEYADLPSAPSPAEIMDHIIPDARPFDVVTAPFTLSEAMNDIDKVNKFLSNLTPKP